MKTALEYLDAAKKTAGIESDYKLAHRLGISRSAISNYRHRRATMDNYVALKLAELGNLNPAEIIAAVEAERAKTEEERKAWENFSKRLRRVAATFALIGIVNALPALVDDTHAAPMTTASPSGTLGIMLNCYSRDSGDLSVT